MHVFQIKGLSGLIVFILSVLAVMSLIVLIPAGLMLVLWNALVFEGFGGPEIGLIQATLLWLMAAILLKIILNPQFDVQFHQASNSQDLEKHLNDFKNKRDQDD